MQRTKVPVATTRISALLGLVLVSACSGPCGLLPGGALRGESIPPPPTWDAIDDYGTVQLETRPDDPYSVNIAFTRVDGEILINAGDTETEWVKNMEANPDVRLRLDGVIYPLHAERVEDPVVIDTFAEAWTNQSMFRRDPRELERAFIYRLRPRPGN